MGQHYKRKTRNFFIKKNLQGRMILAIFLVVILSGLFFVTILGLFSADSLTISYENNNLQLGQTPSMMLKNVLATNWIFLVTCGTFVVLAALVGTHRIAGPMFRFETVLDLMIDKDLSSKIHLRNKDEGKDLAEKINTFNLTLSTDLILLKKHSKAMDDLMSQYQHMSKEPLNPEEVESICKALESNNRKIRSVLESYILRND